MLREELELFHGKETVCSWTGAPQEQTGGKGNGPLHADCVRRICLSPTPVRSCITPQCSVQLFCTEPSGIKPEIQGEPEALKRDPNITAREQGSKKTRRG